MSAKINKTAVVKRGILLTVRSLTTSSVAQLNGCCDLSLSLTFSVNNFTVSHCLWSKNLIAACLSFFCLPAWMLLPCLCLHVVYPVFCSTWKKHFISMCWWESAAKVASALKKKIDKQLVRKGWSSGGARGINGSSYWEGEIKKAEESYKRAF